MFPRGRERVHWEQIVRNIDNLNPFLTNVTFKKQLLLKKRFDKLVTKNISVCIIKVNKKELALTQRCFESTKKSRTTLNKSATECYRLD